MQRRVLREARRFNVLCCGRRWGKSTLGLELATRPLLAGQPVGWFAPTYKLLLESWRDVERVLRPVTRRRNEVERRLELITGGVLEFWTLEDENAGRSRKYARAIVDESGLVKGLLERWQAAIRPTLADLGGDGWLMGTPKGHGDFEALYQRGGELREWASWQRPTDDNPVIAPDEIAAMRDELGARLAAQELDAEFIDDAGVERFLPSMTLWDACRLDLPPLDPRQPLVLALDAAVSGDTFALIGVTRNPARPDDVLVRLVLAWEPNGQPLDYTAIEAELRQLLATHNVVQICYDPYQLHQMAQRLGDTVWCEPFSQAGERLEADRGLLDTIVRRGIGQDGDARLRQHLDNADRKIDTDGRKLRIVKRTPSGKIDLAVALSMACHRALELNLW
jgi:terminase large subunit-like protein